MHAKLPGLRQAKGFQYGGESQACAAGGILTMFWPESTSTSSPSWTDNLISRSLECVWIVCLQMRLK